MNQLFSNRIDAGQQLAGQLMEYANRDDVVVLALPRGGVPVAYEVAKTLHVPLDVFLVRKLGVPGQKELAMGAIASGDVTVFNDEIVGSLQISQSEIDEVIKEQQAILQAREKLYLGDRNPINISGRVVILVDDGIATGATVRVAIKAIKKIKCKKIIVATPVAPPDTIGKLRSLVDEVVCLQMPTPFFAIGGWYEDFAQTTDEEVVLLLSKANRLKNKGE